MSFTPVPSNGIITTAGYYYLTANRTSSNLKNIDIQVDNVFLNLNGKTVTTTSSNPGTAVNFGIYCLERSNIYIFNGKVTGAFFGVHGSYTYSLTLQDVDFTGCTYIGANIGGTNNKVTGCIFSDITGYNEESYAIGVNTGDAVGAVIRNNTFKNLYRQPGAPSQLSGEGVGVLLGHGTSNCVVEDNVFYNDNQVDHTYAIWAVGEGHSIRNNCIRNFKMGLVINNDTDAHNNTYFIESSIDDSIAISGQSTNDSHNNLIVNYENATSGSISSTDDQVYP